jgi:hypothetical protein
MKLSNRKKSAADVFYFLVVTFSITVIVLRALVMILELFL